MISVSQDYKDAIAADNRDFYCEAVITLFDGTVITATNENIWQGGFKFNEATSGQSSFDLGACVSSQFTLILNNAYGTYDGVVFDGASVVAKIGLYDADGNLIDIDGNGGTTFQKGVYFVDEIETNSTFVKLYCLDDMVLFDRDFADVSITFPATLQQIVSAICTTCGVTYTQASFNNSTYTVAKKPMDDTLNCRDVLSMVCEIACSWAKIAPNGSLKIGFYNTAFMRTVVPVSGNLDGGSFWTDVDSADGGSFWSVSTLHDAGTFEQNSTPDCQLSSFFSFNRAYKDVIVYGVRVMSDAAMYLNGTDKYCVTIEGNVLINSGDEKNVALKLGDSLLYASYRAFDADHLADPTIEAGDTAILTDHLGNTYYSVITQTEFSAGEKQKSECSTESASRSTSNRYQAISNGRFTGTTIRNGGGAFELDKNGDVSANNVVVTNGILGGWRFNNNKMYTPNSSGYFVNQYGNFQHRDTAENHYFAILGSSGRSVFRVYYETGDVYVGSNTIAWVPGQSLTAYANSLGGIVTGSGKQLQFTIPLTKPISGSIELVNMTLGVIRADGGVAYARSGASGGTYTALGSTSIIANGGPTRSNEIENISTAISQCGIYCFVNFVYPLAKASGNTAEVTNPAAIAIGVNATFYIV